MRSRPVPELVHRFPFDPTAPAPPQATGLAFAKSGNLYVSLIGPNQIAVLDPSGNEIRRISNPAAWKIFKVYVGETGLPLERPTSAR